jgi:hypothetical protein
MTVLAKASNNLIDRSSCCSYEKLVAEVGDSSEIFEEGEHPPMKTDTKQRLLKADKTFCVL